MHKSKKELIKRKGDLEKQFKILSYFENFFPETRREISKIIEELKYDFSSEVIPILKINETYEHIANQTELVWRNNIKDKTEKLNKKIIDIENELRTKSQLTNPNPWFRIFITVLLTAIFTSVGTIIVYTSFIIDKEPYLIVTFSRPEQNISDEIFLIATIENVKETNTKPLNISYDIGGFGDRFTSGRGYVDIPTNIHTNYLSGKKEIETKISLNSLDKQINRRCGDVLFLSKDSQVTRLGLEYEIFFFINCENCWGNVESFNKVTFVMDVVCKRVEDNRIESSFDIKSLEII